MLRRDLKKRGRDPEKMTKERLDGEVSRQLSRAESHVVELTMDARGRASLFQLHDEWGEWLVQSIQQVR